MVGWEGKGVAAACYSLTILSMPLWSNWEDVVMEKRLMGDEQHSVMDI